MTSKDTFRLGVFLWTEYDSKNQPTENKLHLGKPDNPLDDTSEEVNYRETIETAFRIIHHEDRYEHIDELPSVEEGYYRKLGELVVNSEGKYCSYHDSPPAIKDANGVFVTEKPKYSYWPHHC